MNIEILNQSETSKELKVTVETAQFQERFNQEIKKLSKKVKIDGFRKGKIPLSVVKKRFGKSVNAEITQELVESSSQDYLQSAEELIIGQPSIDKFQPLDKGGFSYSLIIEFLPNFDFDQYKDNEIPIEMKKITDEDFENFLNSEFLPAYAKKIEVTDRDTIQKDDIVVLDMEAYKDGEKVEQFTKTDQHYEVGKNSFGDDFDNNLIGLKIGDNFEHQYVSGEEDSDPVELKVAVKKIETFQTPELTVDFVKSNFPGFDEDLDKFKNQLKEDLQNQANMENNGKLVDKYLDLMAEKYDFVIPKSIEEIAKTIFKDIKQQESKDKKFTDEEFNKLIEENPEEIKKIAKQQIFMLKIKNIEKITVQENEIVDYMQGLARHYNMKMEDLSHLFSNREQITQIVGNLENRKIHEFIINNNKMVAIEE